MPPEGVVRCRAARARLAGRATCVVHGDPNPGNIRMTADRVALTDRDESHVYVPDLDLVLPHNAAGLDDDAYDIAAQAQAARANRRLLGPQRDRPVRSQAAHRSPRDLSNLARGADSLTSADPDDVGAQIDLVGVLWLVISDELSRAPNGGSAGGYQGLIGIADPDHGRALRQPGRMFMHR